MAEESMNVLLTTRREAAEQRNPIALLDLAAYMRTSGHTVDCYYLDQLKNGSRNKKSYDLVGLSVLQVTREITPLRDALFLRKKLGSHVVVGGKWVKTITEEQKMVFVNQGIEVYADAGESYFGKGEVDYEAYPSWDRIDFETLKGVRGDIMTTRGCPHHCHFCHNTEKKLAFFNARRTADNVELLLNVGAQQISFCDDIFTLRPAHMESLYHELRERHISIERRNEFFTHINHINEETVKWIKKYEPFQVNVGIESGDDRMLKLMGKGFDSDTAYNKLKMLHEEARVPIGTLFLIGFPGETEESLQNTLSFIDKIRAFAGNWVSYYQPVRGTVGYEMATLRNQGTIPGGRNMLITYVDPNLSRKILFKYNYRMMNYSSEDRLRTQLLYWLIDVLPCRLLERIRSLRQRKRLKQYMQGYPTPTNA